MALCRFPDRFCCRLAGALLIDLIFTTMKKSLLFVCLSVLSLGVFAQYNSTQRVLTNKGVIGTQNLTPAGVANDSSAVDCAVIGNTITTIQVTGTYTGTLSVQVTLNGTTWITLGGTQVTDYATGAAAATIASGTQSVYRVFTPGVSKVRVTALGAVTGLATVTVRTTPGG